MKFNLVSFYEFLCSPYAVKKGFYAMFCSGVPVYNIYISRLCYDVSVRLSVCL